MKKTKIVATISDLRCDVEFIQSLYDAGMNVVRLNTAHQSESDTLRIVENVRKVSPKIAILVDTKGPEIRTAGLEEPLNVVKDESIVIGTANGSPLSGKALLTNYQGFVSEMEIGKSILIDDGSLELTVESREGDQLMCRACHDGIIKNKKSINVPGVSFHLPSVTEKDRAYISFAIRHNLDFIAHSFVRNINDVKELQDIIDEHQSQIKIIAKIENQEGVDNIDSILDHVYGIMVARGDLGIEVPYETIPAIQNLLIKKCIAKRKPVIIATQMLHSMISEPRPTRAEVNDIANAVWGKTDALMLSGETAYGNYPLEAVQTMARIAEEVEKSRKDFHETDVAVITTDISAYLSKSAVEASIGLDAKAIIADTTWGRTIRNMAGYRGRKEIIAYCYSERTMRELALTFGATPEFLPNSGSRHDFIRTALSSLLETGKIVREDRIVVIGGNFGAHHGASYIEISTVDNLL